MPYIEINLNQALTAEQEIALKTGFGALTSEILGKNEGTLMLKFQDQSKMWIRGKNDQLIAFVQVMLYGSADEKSYHSFSDQTRALLQKITGIDPSNIYVKFEETLNFFWA